jgi:hypothetical protein
MGEQPLQTEISSSAQREKGTKGTNEAESICVESRGQCEVRVCY